MLVNEFGEVGLDGAILGQAEGEGVIVRELAGGSLLLYAIAAPRGQPEGWFAWRHPSAC